MEKTTVGDVETSNQNLGFCKGAWVARLVFEHSQCLGTQSYIQCSKPFKCPFKCSKWFPIPFVENLGAQVVMMTDW